MTARLPRMEWNAARLKFPILSGGAQSGAEADEGAKSPSALFAGRGFFQLCKLGLALTWPLATAAFAALCLLLVLLLRR